MSEMKEVISYLLKGNNIMKHNENLLILKTGILFLFILLLPLELFSQQDKEYPQYLFPAFSEGKIIFKDGQVKNQTLNYNTVTEKIVFIQDGKHYDLMSTVLIDTVIMQDRKFVPSGKIFLEILYTGEYTFFLQSKSDLVPAGKPVGYGGTSQAATSFYLTRHELAAEYINIQVPPDVEVKPSPVYRILKDGEMSDFTNRKQLMSLFPEKENEIKNFIRKNKIKFDRRDNIVSLAAFINSMK